MCYLDWLTFRINNGRTLLYYNDTYSESIDQPLCRKGYCYKCNHLKFAETFEKQKWDLNYFLEYFVFQCIVPHVVDLSYVKQWKGENSPDSRVSVKEQEHNQRTFRNKMKTVSYRLLLNFCIEKMVLVTGENSWRKWDPVLCWARRGMSNSIKRIWNFAPASVPEMLREDNNNSNKSSIIQQVGDEEGSE